MKQQKQAKQISKLLPMRDLKDTVKIESLCSMENGPVFVTKNGYGRLVVMDIEYFQKTMNHPFLTTLRKPFRN